MPQYSERVQRLVQQMTLEEKVSLLAGASFWYTVPVERLGIPAIKVSDGPNGARGDVFGAGLTAACFPAGISLASTWNTELVGQIGQALAEEARSKGASVLLGPTVNIHRSPLNGRNFECFSEDPYLSSRLAVAYISGLQSRGVGATTKHFAGNNSEYERNTISSDISERALREIYLPTFEAAAKEADSWAVMSAYNKVNGTFAGEHHELLTQTLKEEWGWDGLVMSDWFGTNSTAPAVNGGMDLEMPGPANWRGDKLMQTVRSGEVSETVINAAAARVLNLIERTGAFEHPEIPEEQSLDLPQHRAVIRRAAAEGVVLLKNRDAVLPLEPQSLGSIAVIGPNAKTAQIMGGGSAHVNAHYAITPWEGVVAVAGPGVRVGYAIGTANARYTPHVEMNTISCTTAEGEQDGAFAAAYYGNPDLAGEALAHGLLLGAEPTWLGEVGPGIDRRAFSARITGRYTPEESGLHTFGLLSAGRSRLHVNGKELIDNWSEQTPGQAFFGGGSAEKSVELKLTSGEPVELLIEYSSRGASIMPGARLGIAPTVPADSIAQAARLAAESDVALVFVGTTGEWESEGFDRADMELPGEQVALIEAVAAANPRTVVVVQTGSPIPMDWLGSPAAVLQGWFCGQECGNAIADVLFGKVDASGRLPQTFPQRLEDNPTYINYPGDNGRVVYGEGIFVGYRYYDKKRVTPLFPFGYGLSYTSYDYSNLRLGATSPAAGESLDVAVDVTNTGARAGQEVVQLYVRDPIAKLVRPEKELKAFAKVDLQPGETKTVRFTLDRRALAYYDDAPRRWVAEAGEFQVLVGRSAGEIRLTASFTLAETSRFDGPGVKRVALSPESKLKDLIADDEARAIVARFVPGFDTVALASFTKSFTLRQWLNMEKGGLAEPEMAALAAELQAAVPA